MLFMQKYQTFQLGVSVLFSIVYQTSEMNRLSNDLPFTSIHLLGGPDWQTRLKCSIYTQSVVSHQKGITGC